MPQAALFDKALKLYGFTKKEFAQKTNIPYDTVVGWKRAGQTPPYAFELFKKIANDEQRKPLVKRTLIKANNNADLLKCVEVAFWGKNYDAKEVVRKAKRGNKKFLVPILVNIWAKDAIRIIGPRTLLKNLENVKNELPKDKYELYTYLARKNI